MTEHQIELWAEARMDDLDARYVGNGDRNWGARLSTQEQYNEEVRKIDRWATAMLKKAKNKKGTGK